MRDELGTVLGPHSAWVSSLAGNLVERTYHARRREREVDLESEYFASVVVDDRENANSPAARKTVTENADEPSLIGFCHQLQQGATLITDVTFSATSDEKSVRFVDALEPLVVYDNSVTTEQNTEYPIAEAPMPCQHDSKSWQDRLIDRPAKSIARRAARAADGRAGTLLADAFGLESPHRGSPR